MFIPGGTGSVWVPLQKVDWSWSGHALLSNGVWNLLSPSNTATNYSTTNYPAWNSNWQDMSLGCYTNGF